MKLLLLRYSTTEEDTMGLLYIDGVLVCYTLEDEQRTVKVFGETRIPSGTYKLIPRESGPRFYERYVKRWSWHRGMIELENVPNFTAILIHPGNKDDDTAGCILVGNTAKVNTINPGEMNLLDSTDCYKRIYPLIIEEVEQGEAELEIRDFA